MNRHCKEVRNIVGCGLEKKSVDRNLGVYILLIFEGLLWSNLMVRFSNSDYPHEEKNYYYRKRGSASYIVRQ